MTVFLACTFIVLCVVSGLLHVTRKTQAHTRTHAERMANFYEDAPTVEDWFFTNRKWEAKAD